MIDVSKDIRQRVEESLETIRPYLKADGGDVEIAEVTDDMKVKVRFLGACECCPQSYITMSAGIEEAVKNAVPEVQKVESINAVDN